MASVPYDGFAEIYDAWIDGVPVVEEMRSFYVDLMAEAEVPVVELGVGNGRICIEVARRGRPVVGVDSSTAILELCRARAIAAGVDSRLDLIEADFRDFELETPAALIALPFHSIGHLTTDADKLRCMRQVHDQLRPGGLFVWDHFVFDPDHPVPSGSLNLHVDTRESESGRRRLIWQCPTRDPERQVIDILVRVEDLDEGGTVETTRYVRMEMSWLDPERSRELLDECGFEIEELYGDFHRGTFTGESSHQVWLARRA